jgi:hypothetical protein
MTWLMHEFQIQEMACRTAVNILNEERVISEEFRFSWWCMYSIKSYAL